MASPFGSGNKNPPWARQATDFMAASGMAGQSQVSSGLVQQPGLANNPTLYSYNSQAALQQQQFAAQQQMTLQNQAAGLSQPGLAIPTTLGVGNTQAPPVTYPSARPNQAPVGGVGASQKQRVFTGNVTKLHENFGFIDEDVFFQTNCVKGVTPKVGDRVFVEASYNAAMPFKWNATRVQVLSGSQQPMGPQNTGMGSNAAAAAAMNQQQLNAMQQAAKMMNQGGMGGGGGGAGGLLGGVNPLQLAATVNAISNASNLMGTLANRTSMANRGRGGIIRGSRVGRSNFSNETRFTEERENVRERERERERERREKRESRRRSRSSSPASRPRTSRSPKRRSRPAPRYIVQVPRFVLTARDSSVMTLRSKYSNMYVPSDFFSTSSPWVDNLPMNRPFVLGQQCKFHIMHKDVGPLTPITEVLDPPDADHKFCAKVMLLTSPTLIEFYTKTSSMAQDEPDQQESFQHPTRLLQFLVGTRGKNEPMAIGGPWSPSLDGADPEDNPQVLIKTAIRCTKALTGIDLSKCTQWYRFAEIRYLRAESRDKPARVETVVLFLPDVWRCAPSRLDWMTQQKAYALKLQKKLNPDAVEPEEPQALIPSQLFLQEGAEPKKEPTHFSMLDPKSLKLQELRDELDSRSLSSKGLKSQLIARLTKALLVEEEADSVKAQKEKEEAEKKAKEEEEEKEKEKKDSAQKKEEEEQERKKKKERQLLEKRYALPESPAIIVHPSPTAKSGKFDCSIMTLSVLLDYRPEDNKEHSFEVSLFAELFNEMLMRDFGFTIYKALAAAPLRVEEEKKKKDSKDKESKDKDKKSDEPPAKKKKTDDAKKDDEDGDGDQEMEDEDEKDAESVKEEEEKEKKESKREKVKYETVDPALLLACVYYDQNHCGYLLERDLEDIVFSLGLDLSRAQVRKLVQKVLARESFHYRRVCDQPLVKEGETAPDRGLLPVDLDALAKGNVEHRTLPPSMVSASPRGGKTTSSKDKEFVTFRGSVVDLESLMEKLEGSDQSCALLETKLVDMTAELGTTKASLASQEVVVKSVKQELSSVQARLQEEITQRGTMETQRQQWEAAVAEAKVALTQATSALTNVLPDVKPATKEGDKDQEPEKNVEGNSPSAEKVKEEAIKKEKS
ncbi:hypothetical protein ACOMHN_062121 [Nucella lapillus]